MPAPGYGDAIVPENFATLDWVLFGGHGADGQRQRSFAHVDELLVTLGIPRTPVAPRTGTDARTEEGAS